MGVKKEKSVTSKSIGFPSRRTPSLESTGSAGGVPSGGAQRPTPEQEQVTLTPEGGMPPEAYGEGLYDCCAFVIYCPKHQQIAISKGEKSKALWLPFIALKSSDTWQNAAIGGVSYILSHGNIQSFAAMTSVPFTTPEMIHILRVQLPQIAKFVNRITYAVRVNNDNTNWKCCQADKRIQWLDKDDVMNGNVEKLWGPEPYLFGSQAISQKITSRDIQEFSLDDALLFVPHEPLRNKEEEMLKSAVFTERDISKLYSDFIQHVYPSNYMSYPSFVEYMAKLGWSPTDIRHHAIFRAFNYRGTGYLSFHEILLGLGAMDPATQHGGHPGELRCGYIFRYYDVNNDGFLDFNDVSRMTQDIFRGKEVEADEATVDKEAKHRMEAMKLKLTDNLQFGVFLHAVGALTFRGTSVLFRSPIAILQQINLKRGPESTHNIAGIPAGVARRKYRGTCQSCKLKKFRLCLNSVRLDFTGRIIEPKSLQETEGRDIHWTSDDPLTEQMRTYSRDTIFNPGSSPNGMLDILRQFDVIYAKRIRGANPEKKDWMNTDRNILLNSLTAVCRKAEEIFSQETRCVKLTSPVYVLGDIHGNIADLMTYERILWRSGPTVTPASFLFLGDYVDRGEFGVEAVAYLISLKILAPDKFFMCRGNHEIRSIQKVFTYYKECMTKYGTRIGPQIFEQTNKVFDRMPICAVVDDSIYGAHGGIPTSVMKIEDLMKTPTPLQEPEGESSPAWEIMWNDPMNPAEFNDLAEFMKIKTENIHGFLSNTKRGTAFYYTEEAVDNFLQANGLSHILRGHEVMPLGYKFHMGGKVTTVFSSSRYCGGSNESAAMYCDSDKMRVVKIETQGQLAG